MNKESLNTWLSLAANVGVLFSIIFLAIELDQNSDMAASETRNALSQSVMTLIQMESHPVLVEANLKLARGEALNETESYHMDLMVNATLRHWENVHFQFRNGLFTETEFAGELAVWEELMAQQHFREHWSLRRNSYSVDIRPIIDRLVNN